MIYLVTTQQELFKDSEYTIISANKSLEIIESWGVIQVDSETSGRDAHINDFLCVQFGNDKADARMVVDTSTIDVRIYKSKLESTLCVLQNAKFDLQFFFNYGIIIRKVYDTMIVEQLLHLGWPSGIISYSLKAIAERRLGIDIDKTVRGEIIWRGLDTSVILYAAGDVTYLEKIMWSQIEDLKKQDLMKAAQLECNAIPALSYIEWSGIMLDQDKWKEKMEADKAALENSKIALDNFIISNPKFSKYTYINNQGSLFDLDGNVSEEGFYDTKPRCTINWSSSQQVVQIAKELGFDTTVQDKKTGEDKDSVIEKHLANQKGINDEFLKLYFSYQEYAKVVTSFGQGHLNAVNPNTGRIHTVYKQLGAASGRLSCGSNQANIDLAKLKEISSKECSYPNIQQLPANHETRSCFIAPKGYKFASADFSAEESRLGADIYQDKAFLKEFTEGSKDTHNMFAWIVYHDECVALGCKDATEVKDKAPQWRKKVKGYELNYPDSLRLKYLWQNPNYGE